MVLLILIPTAWLAVVFFALITCRLAMLSDNSLDVALAERMATGYFAEHRDGPADGPAEQLPFDPNARFTARRADHDLRLAREA